MLKTAARLLLLRVLPRRILPIVTIVEALLFIRGIRNRSRVKVNPPTRLRTSTAPTARATTSSPSPTSTAATTPPTSGVSSSPGAASGRPPLA